MTLSAALTLSPSEYVWPGLRVSWTWSSPTNLAESTAPSLISFSAAEVSMRVKLLESATESQSTPMPKMSTTQTTGVRRMRLKSMYLRGLMPRPSCSFCHVNRDVSRCGNGHYDGTPHRTATVSPVKRLTWCWCSRTRSGAASGVDVRRQGADVAQVAEPLGVVQAVADDELVGDVKAHVLDVDVDLGGLGLAQKRQDLHRCGGPGLEVGPDPAQRQTRVDDVLDDQHVPASDVGVKVLQDADDAGALCAGPVGRDGHPVHRRGAGQGAHQVGHDHHRTLEDTHQQQVLAFVVAPDVGSQLTEPYLNLRFGDQHTFEVSSHMGGVHGISLSYLFRWSDWAGGERAWPAGEVNASSGLSPIQPDGWARRTPDRRFGCLEHDPADRSAPAPASW